MSFMTLEPQVVLAHKPLESLVAAFVTLDPLVLSFLSLEQLLRASAVLDPLVLPFVLLGQLLLGSVALEPLVLPFVTIEPLVVLAYRKLEPLPLASVNLKKLLVVKKNRSSSSLVGASSQIAPPGRSGIIL